jgi:hypothetical protein
VVTTPQVPGDAQTTDSGSEVWGSTTADARTTPESGPSPPTPEARSEEPVVRSAAFDATVEEIRQRLASNNRNPLSHLENLGLRRLGLAPKSFTRWMLAGLFGIGTRLALALLATAIAGQSFAIPWGPWAVILLFSGLLDATGVIATPRPDVPIGPRAKQGMEDWTALLPTIEWESDLRDLAAFARRWLRPPVATLVGVAVASVVLVVCWLLAPIGFSELPAGSIVLLILLLIDFGVSTVNPFNLAVFAREARYYHRLFWPSPADSPEVQRAIQTTTVFGFVAGLWVTIDLVLAVVLVSWDSPLVVPLSVGFIVIGYVFAFASAASLRSDIQRIVNRSRNERLERLRRRIEAFEPRFDDLSAEESEQARRLIDLHNMIRDAPTTPTTSRTLVRSAAGLIVPTIVFVITVFGEISAERLLDSILP